MPMRQSQLSGTQEQIEIAKKLINIIVEESGGRANGGPGDAASGPSATVMIPSNQVLSSCHMSRGAI